jgi:uncharacterized protein (UPF0276 family)
LRRIESLGVGLGYREPYHSLLQRKDCIVRFIEVIPENFLFVRKEIEELAKRYPVVMHSVGLSVGGDLDINRLTRLIGFMKIVSSRWLSEHASFTRAGGLEIGHLTPLPYNDQAIKKILDNLEKIKSLIETPFLIENITYDFVWPNNPMSEAQFLSRIVEEANIGLLLDLENVYNNSVNFKFNPYSFLGDLPLERLGQIHLAGGRVLRGRRRDTHDNIVEEEVWKMLEWVRDRYRIPSASIEWDQNFPSEDVLLAQIERASEILR